MYDLRIMLNLSEMDKRYGEEKMENKQFSFN